MKLISIALRYCKKIVCVLLIMLLVMAPGKAFADTSHKVDEVTKENLLKQAQVVNWNEFDSIMYRGSRFIVVDYKTGVYWVAERHMGANHADIECVDKESYNNFCEIKNDGEGWKHRPVLIVFEDGRVYCASSFVCDHAGRDDKPFLQTVDDRSHGYGRGENYDKIKGNGQNGHNCIHVKKSTNHFNGKVNEKHQANIKYLENEKNKLK